MVLQTENNSIKT